MSRLTNIDGVLFYPMNSLSEEEIDYFNDKYPHYKQRTSTNGITLALFGNGCARIIPYEVDDFDWGMKDFESVVDEYSETRVVWYVDISKLTEREFVVFNYFTFGRTNKRVKKYFYHNQDSHNAWYSTGKVIYPIVVELTKFKDGVTYQEVDFKTFMLFLTGLVMDFDDSYDFSYENKVRHDYEIHIGESGFVGYGNTYIRESEILEICDYGIRTRNSEGKFMLVDSTKENTLRFIKNG